MRFLLFTDPHITTKAEFSKPTEDGLTDYLHRVIASFDWVGQQVKEHSPDFVAMLGDLFESTGFVDTVSLHVGSLVCEELSRVCKMCSAPLFWLVGNHDIYSNQSHNLKFLHLDEWSVVIERPKLFDIPKLASHPVYFVPWPGEDELGAIIEAKIVLSHIELKGGVLNPKARSEEGHDPLSTPDLWIFNGHYHLPDKLGDRCHQVGSLLSRSFVDGPSLVRGAMLVDFDGNECSIKRLSNPHEIPYRTVEILSPEQATLWSSRIEQGVTGLEDSFVRVVYDDLFQEEAEQLSYLTQGARLEQRTERAAKIPEEFISETFSPEENFKQYVDNVFLFDEDSDRDLALQRGLNYIKAAKREETTSTQPIEFTHLYVRGFQVIGEARVNLANEGLVWIGGVNRDDPADSNGAGKTTLPEALYWAITGRSPRFGDKAGDDVIGWEATDCLVETGLKVGGKPYEIHRGRKPARVSLFMDGEDISARKMKDTEAKIDELIGRSKDVLQHSIFLTSDLETRFTGLSYPERVRLLEKITEAGIYAKVEAVAKTDLKRVKGELQSIRGMITAMEESLTELAERMQSVNGQLIHAKRVQSLELDVLKNGLRGAIAKRDDLLSKQQACIKAREVLTQEESKAYAAVEVVKEADAKIREKVSALGATLNHLKYDVQQKEALIAKGVCPTCRSPNPGESLAPYLAEQAELIKQRQMTHDAFHIKLSTYKMAIEEKKKAHEEVNQQLRELTLERNDIDTRLRETELEIERFKREMQGARGNVEGLEIRREEIKRSIEAGQTRLEQNQAREKEAQQDERVHEFLADAFSTQGIRAQMLSTITVPYLNARIEVYSDILGMPFELTTQVESKGGKREDKVEVILPGKRTYKACSRGERRRIDLAIQCAINDLAIATGGSKVNLLVADEVIDPLDETGVRAFIEVLQHKAKGGTVLLITHKPFLDSHAMKRWTLTKEGGKATLEV